MGDNFLRQQVRDFKKGRDRAQAEQNQPRLFQRPDLLNTVYIGEAGLLSLQPLCPTGYSH